MSSYDDEAALETLLLDSPDLLPGGDGAPLAVVSQLYVPQIGPVDLFAVGPSGGLTVVECKLRANSEIRRSVVGQVLAYASGLWRLSYEELDAAFAMRASRSMIDVLGEHAAKDGGEFSPEVFRAAVTRHLAVGAMRLVIAVDEITDELKRIIEFLNDRTLADLEVMALELGYMAHGGVEILVPTVYGQEAVRRRTAALTERLLVLWPRPSTPESIPVSAAAFNPHMVVSDLDAEDEGAAPSHTVKYQRLWRWLRAQGADEIPLAFEQVEQILDMSLPGSARVHLTHWYGYEGTALGRAIRDAGWRASGVDLVEQRLTFVRADAEIE